MRFLKLIWGAAQIFMGLMFLYWAALYIGSWLEIANVPRIEPIWIFFACLNSFFYFVDRGAETIANN
jgi:hypothetical protein